jgi:hypothetical protein
MCRNISSKPGGTHWAIILYKKKKELMEISHCLEGWKPRIFPWQNAGPWEKFAKAKCILGFF